MGRGRARLPQQPLREQPEQALRDQKEGGPPPPLIPRLVIWLMLLHCLFYFKLHARHGVRVLEHAGFCSLLSLSCVALRRRQFFCAYLCTDGWHVSTCVQYYL